MNNTQSFIKNITPSNYFLTKSMEISKIRKSGTLWYMKKFLVLYDAIFITKKINRSEGINEIVNNFSNYIKTLPDSIQKDAEEFFFPKHADLRGDFRDYNKFAGIIDINIDRKQYYSDVDKYYFAYLMNIGGQSGVKKHIKDELYKDNFFVSRLKEIISKYYEGEDIGDEKMQQIINDFHAAIRNERQILFYYGYFHSRNTGAKKNEFSSLTPIGELAIKANSREFALIWEHQKLKMISQPITVTFTCDKKAVTSLYDVEKFKLNYSPYLSILRCLSKNNKLDDKFYNRILSRSNDENIDKIINNYEEFKNSIAEVEKHIKEFNVPGDIKDEDFSKEIKKYLLGIRADLEKDKSENHLGLISYDRKRGTWEVTDIDKLDTLLSIYNQIEEYKLKKYRGLFKNCEFELKKNYKSTYTRSNYEKNNRTKISWDLYNIKGEKTILLTLMLCDYIMYKNINIKSINFDELYSHCNKYFENILKSLNLTAKKEKIKEIKFIVDMIIAENLQEIPFEEDYLLESVVKNEYSSLSVADLEKKIYDLSSEKKEYILERKRDMRIISLIRRLNIIKYSDEDRLLSCECCGEKTFLNNADEPYIEYHHLIPFNKAEGPDHYENIFGICPTCHRKVHHIKDTFKAELYLGFNNNNHNKKSIEDRLKKLYSLGILKSYQLEYALIEKMITDKQYENIIT